MIKNTEIIIEGSYEYLQSDKLYSVENFKLSRHVESDIHFFDIELLSRIQTGEFLKINIYFEFNSNMFPVMMKIEKSLGEKYSLETFQVNNLSELEYQYTSQGRTRSLTNHFSPKHYLTSPALCTSAVFLMSKKIDANERNAVVLISGHNSWTLDNAAPIESIVYAEYNNRDTMKLNIQGRELEAHSLTLFDVDSFSSIKKESKVELLLSKHYYIPYQLLDKELRINIKQLKKND